LWKRLRVATVTMLIGRLELYVVQEEWDNNSFLDGWWSAKAVAAQSFPRSRVLYSSSERRSPVEPALTYAQLGLDHHGGR
jgi:hypothetical protein